MAMRTIMSGPRGLPCHAAPWRQSCSSRRMALQRRMNSAGSGARNDSKTTTTAFLSTPSWSVRSLLPPSTSSSSTTTTTTTNTITPSHLHHLLRLSALPQPRSPAEESQMLATLHSQLHFVQSIQAVDTTGVEPLQAIRDETAEGIAEETIGLESLRGVLEGEAEGGRMGRRRRRRGGEGKVKMEGEEEWDVLGLAQRKVGRYFVVESGDGVAARQEGEGKK